MKVSGHSLCFPILNSLNFTPAGEYLVGYSRWQPGHLTQAQHPTCGPAASLCPQHPFGSGSASGAAVCEREGCEWVRGSQRIGGGWEGGREGVYVVFVCACCVSVCVKGRHSLLDRQHAVRKHKADTRAGGTPFFDFLRGLTIHPAHRLQ